MTRNSPSSTCPPTESRNSTTRFRAVPYFATDVRSSSATPATMSPDTLDFEDAVRLVDN